MVETHLWKKWKREFRWLRGTPKSAKCSQCPRFSCAIGQRCQLVQHEKSKLHLSSGDSACPTVQQFSQLIDERAKGISLRSSEQGSFKSLKMLWCLDEAVKDLVKQRVRTGLVSASVSQDGQGASIGVRLCLVTSKRFWDWHHFSQPKLKFFHYWVSLSVPEASIFKL